jgi:hypothetical protein
MLALRFLGLIGEDGESQASLQALAEQKENRKSLLAGILHERYALIFNSLELLRTTPMQLEDTFRKYGISGETLDKAVRFFLSAVESAGIAASPLLKARKRNMAPRTRRANGSRGVETLEFTDQLESENAGELPPAPLVRPAVGESITVPLKSGGGCTFSASTSFVKMSREDRVFVFDIIDRMREYESASAGSAGEDGHPLNGSAKEK